MNTNHSEWRTVLEYEILMEKFIITEWKDGTVYRTESRGLEWISGEDLKNNTAADTGIIWAPAPLDYKGQTIRTKRP